MAEELRVEGANVKIRSPAAVFVLALVTLGIYYVVWYYKINRELRDLGIGTSPWTSVIAITLGALILVPPFVSMWNTCGRIAEAERRFGVDPPLSQGVGMLFYVIAFFFLPVELIYLQDHANKAWRRAVAAGI